MLPDSTEERYPSSEGEYWVCATSEGCESNEAIGVASDENKAAYLVEASGAGTGTSAENYLSSAYVEISQEKGPE